MQPLISLRDYRTLLEQVRHPFEKKTLGKLLKKATVTTEQQLPPKTIRLNSIVYLWHSLLRKVVRIRLVPPSMADLSSRNVSAISPLGMSLFGHCENDSLRVDIGGLRKELRIIKVVNK